MSEMAEVMQWLAFAQDEVQFGLQWARGVTVYGRRPESFEGYLRDGRLALDMLEARLAESGEQVIGLIRHSNPMKPAVVLSRLSPQCAFYHDEIRLRTSFAFSIQLLADLAPNGPRVFGL